MLVAEVGCFDIAFSATAVETTAFELVGNHATVFGLLEQGVGDLDQATPSVLGAVAYYGVAQVFAAFVSGLSGCWAVAAGRIYSGLLCRASGAS